jgi:hypothetical protein
MLIKEKLKEHSIAFLNTNSLSQMSDGVIDSIIESVLEIKNNQSHTRPFRLGRTSTTIILDVNGKEVRKWNENKRNARSKSFLMLELLNLED